MATDQTEYLEKLKSRSRITSLTTLFAMLIVLGSLAASFFLLRNFNNQVAELEDQKAALDSEIAEKQEELTSLGVLIKEASDELDSISMETQSEEVVVEKSQRASETLKKAVSQYTDIQAADAREESSTYSLEIKFCEAIVEREPTDCSSSFGASTVYVWASINVHEDQQVAIQWVDSQGNVIREQSYNVAKSPGYRVWDAKTFRAGDAGQYRVVLRDEAGEQIGAEALTITS